MIQPHEVMVGVLSACVLILVALVPGLFESFVEGVRRFQEAIGIAPPAPHAPVAQPVWLAPVGAALLLATLIAWSAR